MLIRRKKKRSFYIDPRLRRIKRVKEDFDKNKKKDKLTGNWMGWGLKTNSGIDWVVYSGGAFY